MQIIAQSLWNYATGGNGPVYSSGWVQLNPVGAGGVSLSGGYLTGITPTGEGAPINSPSAAAYAMPAECTEFDVFDSSGATMYLGVGGTSGTVQQICIIPPGGPSYPIKTGISKGSLLWIKAAASATPATGGEQLIMFRHGRV